jgi:hypothetical protein
MYLVVAAFLVYVFVTQSAFVATWGHFKNADHVLRPLDFFRPDLYTDRGNRLRSRAVWTAVLGALLPIIVYLGCFAIFD